MEHVYLIAEDDLDTQMLIKRAFHQADLNVPLHFVDDGRQAVDYLAGHGAWADRAAYPLPAILLLDLKMPLKDGFEVLQWIRAHPKFKKLVVIMFSGSSLERDVERAFEMGVNSFIIKPVSFHELVQVILSIHHYWFGCNHFPQGNNRVRAPRLHLKVVPR